MGRDVSQEERQEGERSEQLRPNPDFILAKVEEALPDLLKKPEFHEGLVILDPPRSGLHPKVIKALLERTPKHLFYVSCNPAQSARELPSLSQSYKITSAKAYDFFPHTEHYEAFFTLERNT